MNSNRTKYASTPTYGMQKRSFAKKQAAAQPNPTPDFTQHPAMEGGAPVVSMPAQGAFSAPVSGFSPSPATPAAPMYFPNPSVAPTGVPQAGPYNAAPNGPVVYPSYPQAAVPSNQPLGNRVQPAGTDAGFSPRMQGFVPPSYGISQAPNPADAFGRPAAGAYPPQVSQATGAYPPLGAQATGAYPPMGAPSTGVYPPQTTGAYPPVGNVPPMQPQVNPYNGYPPAGMNPQQGYNGGAFVPPATSFSSGSGFRNGPPFSVNFGSSPTSPRPKPPMDPDRILKIILFGVLPVLFIPCVFVTHTFDFLRYLFIVLSVITLSVLWVRQSFTSGVRTTVSVVYLALCIVVIAFLVGGNNDVVQPPSANRQGASAAAVGDAGDVSASVSPTEPTAQETPAPEQDTGASESEQRLSTFMDYWSNNNFESMVNLVLPSWAAKQDDAASALFTVISNRTPKSYTIESITGSNGDSSRTVTMSADIDKNNGKDPSRYRFMILMVFEDNEWYVDPNSLATNENLDNTPTPEPGKATLVQSLAPRMTVTPVPAADTKLYYNPNGGKLYHLDPNCPSINKKFLPLTSYFLYSQLGDAPYNKLSPCIRCGAPTEPLSDASTDATATPAP